MLHVKRFCILTRPKSGSFFLYKSTRQEAVGGAVVVLLHIRGMLSKALLNFDGVRRSPMRQSVMLELSSEAETTLYLKNEKKNVCFNLFGARQIFRLWWINDSVVPNYRPLLCTYRPLCGESEVLQWQS